MKNPEVYINESAKEAIKALYGLEPSENLIQTQSTRKEFIGDITLVVFPLLKTSKKYPEISAQVIGDDIVKLSTFIESYNVVKGF